MSQGGEIARSSAVLLGVRGACRLVTIGTGIGLTHVLEPAAFGAFAFAASIVMLTDPLAALGTGPRLVHPDGTSLDGEVMRLNVLTGMALGFALAALGLAAVSLNRTQLGMLLLGVAVLPLIRGFGMIGQALAQRAGRFGLLAASDFVAAVLGAAAAFAIALWVSSTAWALGAQLLVASLARTIVISAAFPRTRRVAPEHRSSLLAFGLPTAIYGVFNSASRHGDNLLVGGLAGAGALGLYERGYQVLQAPIHEVQASIGTVAYPAMTRLADTPEHLALSYSTSVRAVALLLVPLFAICMAAAAPIADTLFGDAWSGLAPVLFWMAISGAAQALSTTAGWLYLAISRTKEMALWGVAASILILTAVAAGVVYGGVLGAVRALAAINFCLMIPAVALPCRLAGIRVIPVLVAWLSAIPFGVAAACSTCLLLSLLPPTAVGALVSVGVPAALVVGIWLLPALRSKEGGNHSALADP